VPRLRVPDIPPSARAAFDEAYRRALRRGALLLWGPLGGFMFLGVCTGLVSVFRTLPENPGRARAEFADLFTYFPYAWILAACTGLLLILPRRLGPTIASVVACQTAWWLATWIWYPLVAMPLFGTQAETTYGTRSDFGIGLVMVFQCFFAALCPLSPRHAAIPIAAIVGGAIVFASLATGDASAVARFGTVLAAALLALPGAALGFWRYFGMRDRFAAAVIADEHERAERQYEDAHERFQRVHRAYEEVNKELADARRVHEALFPPPVTRGPVRLEYAYEPAAQIGGDFLFVHPLSFPPTHLHPPRGLSVVLIDVTGHGVTAALAVNRLHAELERIFANAPDPEPSAVLDALNAFTAEVLAPRGIFATALCLRVSPPASGEAHGLVEWSSGGHPPALLIPAAGPAQRLESTAPMLGVVAQAFEPGGGRATLAPGDAVVAYTDGAIESRTPTGQQIGIPGFEALAGHEFRTGAPGKPLTARLLARLGAMRTAEGTDDTLLVSIALAPNLAPAPSPSGGAASSSEPSAPVGAGG